MRLRSNRRLKEKLNRRRHLPGRIETLERRDLLAGDPIISEYMSVNSTTRMDQYGEYSDWIEIYNRGDQTVNLDGWYLTNNANNLNQWEFPAETLAPEEYLIVFASNRNEAIAGQELHTNFQLSASGEYLALVQPDAVTVANEFVSVPQFTDISSGHEMTTFSSTLVAADADVAVLIPANGSLNATWTQPGFTTDGSWITEALPGVNSQFPVGFDSDIAVPNLVSNWPLDEPVGTSGTGSVADASNSAQHGTPTGSIAFASSGANNFTFTGADFSNGSIDVPYDASLNGGSFTAMAWVRPESVDGYASVFTSRYDNAPNLYGYILYNAPGGQWSFWTGPGNGGWATLAGPAVVTDDWAHVAISFDANSNSKTIWINGQVGASTTAQGYAPNPVRDLHIGGGADFGDQFRFDGTIDDVAIFDAALDQADIQAYMNNGVPESASSSYGELIETDVTAAMEGENASAYIRSEFTLANPTEFTDLRLNVQYDDGFVAYLNGQEIARRNAPATLDWNSTAQAPHPDSLAVEFETIEVGQFVADLLPGDNVLAIHGLNIQAADSDFLLAAELVGITAVQVDPTQGYFSPSTPESINPSEALVIGPLISNVGHTPAVPNSSEAVVVTAEVSARVDTVNNVSLIYRAMYAGESTVAMLDDGLGNDVFAADGIFTATIPAGLASSNQMLRYRIEADDISANSSVLPANLDKEGKKQSPEYFGTVISDSAFSATLPVYQWFTANVNASHTRVGTRASVFFNDRFYDNVFVRQRGGFTNAAVSQKFVFNKGEEFYLDENHAKLEEINVNGPGSDGSYLRQPMGFSAHQEALGAGSTSFLSLLTVNGAVDRVGIVIEQVDEEFLNRNGYDADGDLYKFVQRSNLNPVLSDTSTGVEKKSGDQTDFSSINALVAGLNQGTTNDQQTYARDVLDIPQIINYLAVRSVQQQADDVRKNFYMYVDKDGDGLWRIFPWDLDWTFEIVGGHGGERTEHPYFGTEQFPTNDGAFQWNVMYDVLLDTPEVQRMLLRRMRTLMDEFYGGPSGGTTWFAEYVTANYALADPHLPNNVNNAVTSLQNSIQNRRNDLYIDLSANVPGTSLAIPQAQVGNPNIEFGTFEFAPLSGNQDEEFIELVNTNADDVDISGWKLAGGVDFTFAPGTVIPANDSLFVAASTLAFKSRTTAPTGGQDLFIVGGYSGHLSNFGETVELLGGDSSVVNSLTYAGNPSDAQQFLRITELNYNPHAPTASELLSDPMLDNDDFEYVEFVNTGTQPLDLTGVQITAGVIFTFGNVTLNPNEHVLVVKDQAAFEIRYGTGLNIAGEFASGSLNNGGEAVKIEDSLSGTIHEFAYNDSAGWPVAADGRGGTLEVVDTVGDYSDPINWRSSTEFAGTPAIDGVGPLDSVVINEVLSHTDLPQVDSIELYNPTAADINIGGWYLSDSVNQLAKYPLPPNTIVLAGQYLVINETHFNPTPATPSPNDFALSGAHGDDVWLVEANGAGDIVRFIDNVEFGAQANGESWGRWPNAVGEMYPQAALSLNGVNSGPRVGPLVISELMYNPIDPDGVGGVDAGDLEFVEIHNPSGAVVELTNWQLHDGVDFTFPDGLSIADGGRVVVLSFDPDNPANAGRVDAFRTYYGLDGAIELIGGYAGKLSNGGERVQLLRPDIPPLDEPEFIPLLLEDEVVYGTTLPWPVEAAGGGLSLVRSDVQLWGDDAESWHANIATPGTASAAPEVLDVAINSVRIDPPDLSKGAQPTSWQAQRSWLASLAVNFSEPVAASPSDLVLTNLGKNAPVDDDVVFNILPEHFNLTGSVLTLTFAAGELADGVYQLEIRETVTDLGGEPLDGNRDGASGDAYRLTGSNSNGLYRMESDWNGDEGVSVFDFTTFSYWFGQSTGQNGAPEYADLNDDDGVSVFDFTGFSRQFGDGVTFPVALQRAVAFAAASSQQEAVGERAADNVGQRQTIERWDPQWLVPSRRAREIDAVVASESDVKDEELDELLNIVASGWLQQLG